MQWSVLMSPSWSPCSDQDYHSHLSSLTFIIHILAINTFLFCWTLSLGPRVFPAVAFSFARPGHCPWAGVRGVVVLHGVGKWLVRSCLVLQNVLDTIIRTLQTLTMTQVQTKMTSIKIISLLFNLLTCYCKEDHQVASSFF